MQRRTISSILAGAAFVSGVLLAAAPAARAVGNNAGELGGAGIATGDISREPGETDRVGVDFVAGVPTRIGFRAGFAPLLVVTGPDDAPVDLGPGTRGRVFRVADFRAPVSGRYEFAISSADGTQGAWTLAVRPVRKKKERVAGAGDGTIAVAMPADGILSAKFRASSPPSIVRVTDPDGAVILGPIAGTSAVVKLPSTAVALPGTYVVEIHVEDGTAAWSGKLTRLVPKVPQVELHLTNGLSPILFEADGIGALFSNRCGGCHDWARSYSGVRGYARDAVSRMKSGSMPKSGARVPASDIALVEMWIETGMLP